MNRSENDITALLQLAKLNKSELRGSSTCLYFSKQLHNEELKLIEVDEELANALLHGETLTIRGEKTDGAVLCTQNKTYELREAETSNSLLLLPSCATDNRSESGISHKEVIALKYDYLEVRIIRPRLRRLKTLLEENLYSGREFEEDDDHQGKKFTESELLNVVQCSEEELQRALLNMNACLVDGCWRMLDMDLRSRVLQSLLALRDELGGWNPPDAFPVNTCCSHLEDLYPKDVTRNVLQGFSEEFSEREGTCKLNEDKICRFYAELLLKSVNKFNLQEFETAWKMTVPEGYCCERYQLEGLAIIDDSSRPAIIRYFPVAELPEDAADRFEALFKAKDRWTAEEITPFISDLCADKTGQGNLLMKHSRAYTVGGIRVHSSKKINC